MMDDPNIIPRKNGSAAAWADGARVPIANDRWGDVIAKFVSQFGVSEAAAFEHAKFWDEYLPTRAEESEIRPVEIRSGESESASELRISAGRPSDLAPEAAPVNGHGHGGDLRRFRDWFERFMHFLVAYMDRQADDPKLLRMSVRAAALAAELPLVAGGRNATELARALGLGKLCGGTGKQTANKCLAHFIKQLGKDPIPGARTAAARENMSAARERQLKTTNGH